MMKAVHYPELARFLLTGVIATIGNIAAVRLVRPMLSYDLALLVGIAAGVTISFLLTKLFAFRSRSWGRAPGEAARFLLVYAGGCVLYWASGVGVSRVGIEHGIPATTAETGGIIVGAGIMAVSSYFGHRFFTYRSHQDAVAG
jgi:putative flippase GtrA